METKTNEYYLEQAPITKAIAFLAIPMMIGVSVGTIYNLINAFFIGLLHDTTLMTAVTLGLPIFTLLMAVGNMLGVGGGTFITRLIAVKETERARQVARHLVVAGCLFGALLGVTSMWTVDPFARLLGATTPAVLHCTKQYVSVMFIGAFSLILNFTLEQVVRSEGAAKASMKGIVLAAVINLVSDVLFILVLKWAMLGVALALILANVGSVLYYLYYLQNKSEHLQGFLTQPKKGHKKRLAFQDVVEIYQIGVSELFLAAFLIVTGLLSNHYCMKYGEPVVAGFGVVLRIVQIPEFLSMGLAMGIVPLIAYNFSVGNHKRLNSAIRQTTLWIIGLSGTVVAGSMVFRAEILRLFSSDARVLEVGMVIMMAMLISALFNGLTTLLMGIFQASGKAMETTVMSVIQGTLYIPVIILFNQFWGLNGVIWSMTFTECVAFITASLLFALSSINKVPLPKENI